MTGPAPLSAAALSALAIVARAGERGTSAKGVAKALWPDSTAWHRSAHNGVTAPNMPMKAGTILWGLQRRFLVRHEHYAWFVTPDGTRALVAAIVGEPEAHPTWPCTTKGCPGDGRYASPGRGHLPLCDYPRSGL